MSESIARSGSGAKPGIVAIGGSAGSMRALLALARVFSPATEFPVVIVIHRIRHEESRLDQILEGRLHLSVHEADDKEPLRDGTVYVAPADYHVLIEEDHTLALADLEHVKHSRPSIDVTFASVADVYGESAIAILLSGANDDGADGLAAIARRGGRVIVQSPHEAEVDTMPRAGIEAVPDCAVMGIEEMSNFLKGFRGNANTR